MPARPAGPPLAAADGCAHERSLISSAEQSGAAICGAELRSCARAGGRRACDETREAGEGGGPVWRRRSCRGRGRSGGSGRLGSPAAACAGPVSRRRGPSAAARVHATQSGVVAHVPRVPAHVPHVPADAPTIPAHVPPIPAHIPPVSPHTSKHPYPQGEGSGKAEGLPRPGCSGLAESPSRRVAHFGRVAESPSRSF